tara:strand:- start:2716 stop:2847 length:132 start_codon:yes stop_codon:yes gene_type:complete
MWRVATVCLVDFTVTSTSSEVFGRDSLSERNILPICIEFRQYM